MLQQRKNPDDPRLKLQQGSNLPSLTISCPIHTWGQCTQPRHVQLC